MNHQQSTDLQTSYTRVADEYARHVFAELQHKPFDQDLLNQFAEQVRGRGIVCDLGCGPGQVARYLHERGVDVIGVDLAPGMLEQARRLNPEIAFHQGNMLALDVADAAWAGIVAFYSIIHVPRSEQVLMLMELKRVLQPGGVLLLAFHIGSAPIHLDRWWDQPVALDFNFFHPAEVVDYLQAAGFIIDSIQEREPYAEVEHQSRRAYIMAHRPTVTLVDTAMR